MLSGFLISYRVYEPDEINWKRVRESLFFKERTPYIGLLETVFAFLGWDPWNKEWDSYGSYTAHSENSQKRLSFGLDAYLKTQVGIVHEKRTRHNQSQQELLRGKGQSSLFTQHEKTNRLQSRIEDKQWKTERLRFYNL